MRLVAVIALWWTLQGEVHVDPETGDRYHLERPAEGAARGRWSVPSWVVWAVGGTAVVGSAGALLWGIRRKRAR